MINKTGMDYRILLHLSTGRRMHAVKIRWLFQGKTDLHNAVSYVDSLLDDARLRARNPTKGDIISFRTILDTPGRFLVKACGGSFIVISGIREYLDGVPGMLLSRSDYETLLETDQTMIQLRNVREYMAVNERYGKR